MYKELEWHATTLLPHSDYYFYWSKNSYCYMSKKKEDVRLSKEGMMQVILAHSVTKTNNSLKTFSVCCKAKT